MYVLFPFARCQHYHARTPYDCCPLAAARVCNSLAADVTSYFVAIAVDIQETAEDRTICSKLSIAPVVFILGISGGGSFPPPKKKFQIPPQNYRTLSP